MVELGFLWRFLAEIRRFGPCLLSVGAEISDWVERPRVDPIPRDAFGFAVVASVSSDDVPGRKNRILRIKGSVIGCRSVRVD